MTLRPATADDTAFLLSVYGSVRETELAPLPWSEEEKAAFVRQQFEAQDAYYRAHYANAEFLVIEEDGVAAGRLYVHRTPGDIRIMDIALLPPWRGRGMATQLIKELQAEAARGGAIVSLHVEAQNPARRLYERLGFEFAEGGEIYDRLEWRANAASYCITELAESGPIGTMNSSRTSPS